ncbi:hypothetical protein BXU08_13915 [Sphingomonas sp. LM7]|nr:hypothetical protein BXU08_13915 [Sphingomonas sp. LM7]
MTVFAIGQSLLFDTVGVLGDSMADGFALLTGICYLMLALLVHLTATIALGVANVRRWRTAANHRSWTCPPTAA